MEWEAPALVPASETQSADAVEWDVASVPYVGRWNQLVSDTNWEKGRIIQQWREAIQATGSPSTEYSDDAWSRRVGGVSGQHVGRLRRVSQRFGTTHSDYADLHWSHFHAAVDWDDAEMWLEGAVQNRWSVSQLRRQRWETLGRLEEDRPRDEDIVPCDLDEDCDTTDETAADADLEGTQSGSRSGPLNEGPDFGGETATDRDQVNSASRAAADEQPAQTVEFVRPFKELGEMPTDLAEAFEAFKLAILHHKLDGWQQVASADVLASLEALKQLVVAPSDEAAPF